MLTPMSMMTSVISQLSRQDVLLDENSRAKDSVKASHHQCKVPRTCIQSSSQLRNVLRFQQAREERRPI